MKKKIDMKQFMLDCELTNEDKRRMKSIDKKTMKDDPNYPKNKKVNLEYYAEDELDDARWFSRQELDDFGEWGDEKQGFKKAGKESISRYLLDYWHYDLKALGA